MTTSAFYWRDAPPPVVVSSQGSPGKEKRTPEQVDELTRRVAALEATGIRPTEICERCGITRRYLQQLRKRAGLGRSPYPAGRKTRRVPNA